MNCHKCGKPLPSEGYTCKFCGTMMTPSQIAYQNRQVKKDITLLSDQYGVDKKSIYENPPVKENKLKGLIFIVGILLFLIILVIIVTQIK